MELKDGGNVGQKKSIEMVNSPDHYKGRNGYEAINLIDMFGLNFNLGNVVKYVIRADKKGKRLEDLMKADFYLNREIEDEHKKDT